MMQQQKFLSGTRTDFFLLLLIVITGTVLRFIFFDRCPYTHDEISSLTRAGYSSFSELIEKGVKPDTHPPLLQIFLQYYIKIFGSSEMVVKFPFVVCGILSIYLTYLLAAKWFGSTTGLLSAAVMSTVQYTVMYSVIARHYSMGLFFTLLLVYCQVKFFETEDKKRFRWLAAFTVIGVACSYLHYFCLLFTAVAAVTGFLFVNRKNLWYYLIACLLIPVLFLPYLPVFFVQFGYKGIGGPEGWLGAPDRSFFLKYPQYMFHYSYVFLFLVAAIFLFGVITSVIRYEKIFSKHRLICLAWFLLPLLTAYFYSAKVNPILQYSIVIFSFPYLLMFLFSFLHEIRPLLKTSMVVLILAVGTITLVHGRKHYKLFYNQGINKILSEITSAKQQLGADKVEAIIDVEDYFLNYYKLNYPVDKSIRYEAYYQNSFHTFKETVSKLKTDYLVFATVRGYPLECLQVLKEHYPYIFSKYKGHLTEIFLCSKTPVVGIQENETIFSSENNFTSMNGSWNFNKQKVLDDSLSGKKYFRYDTSDEFGVEFKMSLDQLVKNKNNLLHISAEAFINDTASSPLLVMSMESPDTTIDWRAAKFLDYLKPGERGNVYLSLRFSDISIDTKNMTLKVYVWNKDRAAFNLFNMKVRSEKGNPYFYGLFEAF